MIKSLRTELRDGVRLTRLVELLLYPPTQLSRPSGYNPINMPTGAVPTKYAADRSNIALFPCLKYPVREVFSLHNVQIALNALAGARGLERVVDGIQPEDVMDGHREKTMKYSEP